METIFPKGGFWLKSNSLLCGLLGTNAGMIALDTIPGSEFEACLHEIFSLVLSDGNFPLELDKVTLVTGSHPKAKREPFTLTFKAGQPIRLPQSIYTLKHERLGPMEIFLVQTSPTEVEAVFN